MRKSLLPEWWPDMGAKKMPVTYEGGSDRWETDTEVASAATSKTTNCIRGVFLRLVPKENP